MSDLFYGLVAGLAGVAGLFFFRFWVKLRDRFFVFFALAFWAMAANWLVLAANHRPNEGQAHFYLPRLVAFVLIIVAIYDKNRGERRF